MITKELFNNKFQFKYFKYLKKDMNLIFMS